MALPTPKTTPCLTCCYPFSRSVVQFEAERDQLAAMLHESQKQVADFQRALEEARRLEPTCKQLQDANQSLQQQLNAARDEVIALTGRLEEEIHAKKRVEELRVKLEV